MGTIPAEGEAVDDGTHLEKAFRGRWGHQEYAARYKTSYGFLLSLKGYAEESENAAHTAGTVGREPAYTENRLQL